MILFQGNMIKALKKQKAGYLLVAPALLTFIVFLLYPIINSLYLSCTEWKGFDVSEITFVGLRNFVWLSQDELFWRSLYQTIIYVLTVTFFLNLVGFLLALIIEQKAKGYKVFRAIVFLPVLMSMVIVGVMWSRLLDPFGFVNLVLEKAHLGYLARPWLGDRRFALGSVVAANVWQWAGFDMVIYYAGLQGIPRGIYEAASIDGTTYLQRVRLITLPLLKPAITVAVVLNLIGGFRVFDLVWVMTKGGPNYHSEVLATYLYKKAFSFHRMGVAAAVGLIILVFAFVASYIRLKTAGEVTQ